MKKQWYKKWWAIVLYVIIGLIILGSLLPEDEETQEEVITQTEQEIKIIEKTSGFTVNDCYNACDKYPLQAQANVCYGSCDMVGKEGSALDTLSLRIIKLTKPENELSCEELFSNAITDDCFWEKPEGFGTSHKCYHESIGNDNSPPMTYWNLWEGREQQNFVQVQVILQLCNSYTKEKPFTCDKGELKGIKYYCNPDVSELVRIE